MKIGSKTLKLDQDEWISVKAYLMEEALVLIGKKSLVIRIEELELGKRGPRLNCFVVANKTTKETAILKADLDQDADRWIGAILNQSESQLTGMVSLAAQYSHLQTRQMVSSVATILNPVEFDELVTH